MDDDTFVDDNIYIDDSDDDDQSVDGVQKKFNKDRDSMLNSLQNVMDDQQALGKAKQKKDESFTTKGNPLRPSAVSKDMMSKKNETEAAMDRLDDILGSGGIDKILKQQQDLKHSVKHMSPLLNNATKLLEGLNNSNLIERLSTMADGLQR